MSGKTPNSAPFLTFFLIELVNLKFNDVPIETAPWIRNKLTDTTVFGKISAEHGSTLQWIDVRPPPFLFFTRLVTVEMSRWTQDARPFIISTVEIHIPKKTCRSSCLALPLSSSPDSKHDQRLDSNSLADGAPRIALCAHTSAFWFCFVFCVTVLQDKASWRTSILSLL